MFYIRKVTLTNANTNYKLYTLMNDLDPRCPARCAEVQIQANSANAGTVLVGDGSLSATNYGKELDSLDGTTVGGGSDKNGIALKNIYLRSATAGQVCNIIVRVV